MNRGRTAPRSRSREGLTLIEIMIVIVIVAIASTGMSIGLGALTKASLRSACVRMMSATRFAYHRALSQGTTVRLTLDFDKNTYTISEAEGRVSLVRSDAPLRERAERAAKDEEDDSAESETGASVDPWAAARARLEQPDALTLPPSPFSPVTTPSGKTLTRYVNAPIGDDIRLAKVIVAHEAEAVDEGKVDLFFFPSGLTQHAVIQLEDKNQVIFSVEIHPLTGRATIHDVPYEPEVLMDDPNERDDSATELEDR